MSSHPGKRILIVGTTGAGKSTLAQTLSETLGIPHVELDDLHWDANWTSSLFFEERVSKVVEDQNCCWIVDGNYQKARPISGLTWIQ